MKCQGYPNMVFKGTLHNEGHSVTFNILDNYVEITDTNGAMISVKKIDTDNAITVSYTHLTLPTNREV